MTALLRADWIRLRRRRDFWIILVAVLVMTSVSFVASYRSDSTDPPPFNQAEFEQMLRESGMYEGLSAEEAERERVRMVEEMRIQEEQNAAAVEAQQQLALRRYVFPQSLLTILGSALLPFLALALIAAMATGDEFRFRTIRTSLLAVSDRRRFLLARMTSMTALAVGLIAAILLLGLVLSAVLAVTDPSLPAAPPLEAVGTIVLVATDVLVVVALMAFATAVTLFMRTGSLALLILIVYGLIELFVANLAIFSIGERLAAVPQFFFVNGIRALQSRASFDAGALPTPNESPPAMAVDLGLPVMVAIVAAWMLLFLVLADRRIRTMDVVE
jgi:ABC-2 family transporter protein